MRRSAELDKLFYNNKLNSYDSLMFSDSETHGAFTTEEMPVAPNISPVVNPIKVNPLRKSKKKVSPSSFFSKVFMLLFCFFFVVCVFPFSIKTFVLPLFDNADNSSLRVNYSKILSPTSQYLHNNFILGLPYLKGAEQKKPLMDEMKLTSRMYTLQSQLLGLASEYRTIHPSVFVWDYETGKFASVNSDEIFPAASIIKIPVLLQFFRSVEAGQINTDDKMILTDYYKAGGSGDLQFQRNGNEYTMDALARKMIQISDNSSTNMLMASVGGMNDINRAVKSWGLRKTEVNNWLPDLSGTNVTTCEDLARMLFNIDNDKFLSAASKEKIFDYMGHVKNNRLIHAGLGPDSKFFHKTGDIGHMLGDAGIVVTASGRKYIVCILAKRPYNSPAGKSFTVRASEMIYKTLNSGNF